MMSNRPNIVRVSAKTALPIISSVPKCRDSSRNTRTYLLDTSMNSTGRPERLRPIVMQQQVSADGWRDQELSRQSSTISRHTSDDDDRVLLIVNDDHINGGGIPIIGRRLPSKSRTEDGQVHYNQQQREIGRRSEPEGDLDVYFQPPTIQIEQSMQMPVVGRRSHRLQRSTNPATGGSYREMYLKDEYNELILGKSNRINQPARIIDAEFPHAQQTHRMLPRHLNKMNLGSIETSSRRSHRDGLLQSVSSLDMSDMRDDRVIEYPSSMQRENYKQPTRYKPLDHRAESQTILLNHSSHESSMSDHTRNPRRTIQDGFYPASYEYSENYLLDMTCDEPCCRYTQSTSNQNISGMKPKKKVPPCCASPLSYRPISRQEEQEEAIQQRDQNRQTRPLAIRFPYPNRANNEPPQSRSSVGPRSSSCHDSRRVHRENHTQRHPGNVPPVPNKPKINYSKSMKNQEILKEICCKKNMPSDRAQTYDGIHRSNLGQYPSPELAISEDKVVTQMYESLAAELKAKLGDPKHAPILLPPKDYDTMSRRQGKLVGIEQRRSTNPQLVGPAANRSAATTIHEDGSSSGKNLKEIGQQVGRSPEPITVNFSEGLESARSSGRNHDGLHRSRSNSSSGLGSFSIDTRSPQSSPTSKSSSSEDMSCAIVNNSSRSSHINSRGNNKRSDIMVISSQTKNSISPSDCSNSDSGHSGSSRLQADDGKGSGDNHSIIKGRVDGSVEPIKKSSPNIDNDHQRGKGIQYYNPSRVSDGVIWNGRVEIPLKVNSNKRDGNTYLATKQIIY